jgi:hypothetical protein
MWAMLGVATASAASHAQLRTGRRGEGFVKALGFQHRLRVCNAYPYASALDVVLGKGERLTGDEPMPYKTCRDLPSPLKGGDKLEFKVGDATAGTFSVSDLPNNDATLLLVIHRHDTLSTAVAFESHVFAKLANAQVAIIDTYKGKARATPKIKDSDAASKKVRSEELRYNSVVAVNPGTYEVELDGEDGETKARSQLVALNRESYVVLRTGVEAQQGESYPQSLVVFPRSDAKALQKPHHSGAAAHALALPVATMAALLALASLGFS